MKKEDRVVVKGQVPRCLTPFFSAYIGFRVDDPDLADVAEETLVTNDAMSYRRERW